MPRKMGQPDSLAPRPGADRADDFRELLEPGAIRSGLRHDLEVACWAAMTAAELRSQARERLGSTLSVGLALAGTGESDEAVVARADGALYDVKRPGRVGVRLARPA
jgi:GGDEF domain-containing protein